MKDKFRVKFSAAEAGWIIQYSRLGLCWETVGKTVFSEKTDALQARKSLALGVSPDNVFSPDFEDGGAKT